MLDIVMPVCGNDHLTSKLFQCLEEQTVLPATVFIIDNGAGGNGHASPHRDLCGRSPLPTVYLPQERNIGVNASWNLALTLCKSEYVSILNNDLLINKWFIEKVERTFIENPNCGGCVPNTLPTIQAYESHAEIKRSYQWQPHREGWAFSVRRELWEKIPSVLKTFLGDDFIFAAIQRRGYIWIKTFDNHIFHYVSQSLYSTGADKDWPADLEAWHKLPKGDSA